MAPTVPGAINISYCTASGLQQALCHRAGGGMSERDGSNVARCEEDYLAAGPVTKPILASLYDAQPKICCPVTWVGL